MEQRILLATLLLTLLAGSLTWWMVRRQLSPLSQASKKLAMLSESNQHLPFLEVKTPDEIGQLIGSFNRLFATLGKRDMALKESEYLLKEAQRIAGTGSYVLDIPERLWKSSETFDQIFGIDASYDRS
ncbi:HAMP domain-containing protein, partial [bacterium]|nr:HAMP domain-containing protein [bacterium]